MAITTKQQSVPPIAVVRHDYRADEVRALFDQPFFDLLHQAHTVHRHCFDANRVQLSTLLNIKTGACPEDCAYCPQSAHHHADLTREQLMSLHDVTNAAEDAKANGATRFCMGAAWRNPTDKNLDRVIEMIKAVKALGMETCVTLGMLTDAQARRLKDAGLDYYNHNIDTSEDYYDEIISTRTFGDRLQTLAHVRDAGMNVCCGGIVGMGERIDDRAEMLRALANLPTHPQSVPINRLVAVPGTPLADAVPVDEFDFIRTIAVARIIMPHAYVRLSAGRETMSDTMQALALYAGANSIFYGEKLLTTPNAGRDHDNALFARLGVRAEAA